MKELTKWDFKRELRDLAENCTKLKPSTAKGKATKLLDKYNEIMANSKRSREYDEKEADKYR